jgi:predicted histidine transporter YuiF (NhaC family)
MSMMPGLSDLEGNALAKVLRRTIVSSLIGGGGGIIVALLLSAPWAALGIVIGLGMAIVNLRFLDAGVAKVQTKGETNKKAVRRAMGTKSVTRLAVITVIAIGLMFLNGGLGIGAVTGLVIFQLFFVLNVGRVLVSQGVQ